MRQGQQNKRMRGRGRNKSPNQANRVYESNGPDVKVRGTAPHVAEKYQSLARDAQSSGDTIAAENYLQHAEHYLRIIAAAQAQNQAQQQPQQDSQDHGEMNGAEQRGNGAAASDNDDAADEDRAQADDNSQRDNSGRDGNQGGGRRRRGSAVQADRAQSADGGGEGDGQPASQDRREKEDASDAAEPAA